jgi:quinol monooxygenase YgiN
MSDNTILFAVDLAIHEGGLQEFENTVRAMIAASDREPGTLGYEWFLSGDRRQCRLIETYRDGDAALAHLTGPVVQKLVPQLLHAATLQRFEVYGDPGKKASEMLAGFGAAIFSPWHGLRR